MQVVYASELHWFALTKGPPTLHAAPLHAEMRLVKQLLPFEPSSKHVHQAIAQWMDELTGADLKRVDLLLRACDAIVTPPNSGYHAAFTWDVYVMFLRATRHLRHVEDTQQA